MYLGMIVERADAKELFENPLHPYTKELLKSIPVPDLKPEHKLAESISGEVTSAIDPPDVCRFLPRCKICQKQCYSKTPELKEIKKGHWVACELAEKRS